MQFSLKIIFGLVTLCAIAGLAFTLLQKPETHSIASYEEAQPFFGRTAKMGPNQIRIESVARNGRSGAIKVTTGRGEELKDAAVANAQQLVTAAPWLDVAQVTLGPGIEQIDLINVRVFDHAKRELLNRVDPAYGWRVIDDTTLQIYGLGKELPTKLDLWFRLNSYDSADKVYRLDPNKGAEVKIGEGTLRLSDVREGTHGWSSDKGFVETANSFTSESSAEFETEGIGPDVAYQISAVSKFGRRVIDHLSYKFPQERTRQGTYFQMPLDEIDHFEIRRFGGRHRFYFDGVEFSRPTGIATKFAKPPKANVLVNGAETKTQIKEFLPLAVYVSVLDGQHHCGSSASENGLTLVPMDGGPLDVGNSFSLVLDQAGVADAGIASRFRVGGNKQWVGGAAIKNRGGSTGSTSNASLGQSHFETPLSTIDEIELSIQR